MKLNRQFQDLHMSNASADWVLKQQIERDICLLFHQLSNYSYIMGDLYYGSVFSLPYWEYLDFSGLEKGDGNFLRDGCLVMILSMAWDRIDGGGAYISQFISLCQNAVTSLVCDDEDTQKLARTVQLALTIAEQSGPETSELQELSAWVYKHYVRGYFRRVAQEFDSNPYFHG